MDTTSRSARAAVEMKPHRAHTFLGDALDGTAPACVEDSDCAFSGIDEDDRQAVGGLNSEHDAGSVG